LKQVALVISAIIAGYLTFTLYYYLSIFLAPDLVSIITSPISHEQWFLDFYPEVIRFLGIDGLSFLFSLINSLCFGSIIGISIGYWVRNKLFLRVLIWATLMPILFAYSNGISYFTEISNGQLSVNEIVSARHNIILQLISHYPALFLFISLGRRLSPAQKVNKNKIL
jgi:hypothetical protein